MAVVRNAQREQAKNVLLRVSIPMSLMAEIKKTSKLCREKGLYFNIKPDVIEAVTKAVEEARDLIDGGKEQAG